MDEKEALAITRKILLSKYPLRPRPYTGGKGRERTKVQTKKVSLRIPTGLLNKLNERPGGVRPNVERAIRIFLELAEPKRKR